MAENTCSEVAEPAQTSSVQSQLHLGSLGVLLDNTGVHQQIARRQNKTHVGAEKL